MTTRRAALLLVCGTIAAGAIAPAAANAAISVSSPVTRNLYVDSVFVSWSTTTTPRSIQMVWTCTGGYCLAVGTAPITLNLVSTSTHSSFSFQPGASTQASLFTNWTGPLPDGQWSVQMKYVDTSSVTYPSSTILQVQTSSETTPPIITSPAANTETNTVPVAYNLYSTPGSAVGDAPTLTFTNTATSASSVLQLSSSVTSASFSLNPANLSASSSVLGVTGPNSLADGTYNVAMTYTDNEGVHPAATTVVNNWTLDTSTPTPTVSAPAAGSSETGPFDLTFDLPHTALSGSVQLTFNGSIWPITLGLADTSPGVHTLLLDPNALNSNPDVTSVNWNQLAPGSYTAAVSYRDQYGNPTATSVPLSFAVAVPGAQTSTPAAASTAASGLPSGVSNPGLVAAPPVAAPPTVELPSQTLHAHVAALSRQRIRTSMQLPAAGDLDIIATAADPTLPWASISSAPVGDQAEPLLRPGWHRFTFASVTATKVRGGGYSFTLTPTLKGELLIRRHRRHGWALHVLLTIEFRGTGGQRVIDRHRIEILRSRR